MHKIFSKLVCILVISSFTNVFSEIANERKLYFLESLIEQGDYEDAILEGEKQLKKYNKNDSAIVSKAIANALLSRAYYHWYHFKESDKYYKLASVQFNSLILDTEERLIAGMFLTETALQRFDYTDASKIIDLTPKPSIKTTFFKKAIHATLQAKIKSAFGEHIAASKLIDSRIKGLPESTSPDVLVAFCILQSQKMKIAVEYGNLKEADTLIKDFKEKLKGNKALQKNYAFHTVLTQANIFYKRRQYYKAAVTYLDAYHALEGSEEEYRRFEALKMSAISSIKAGTVSDYHKLFRRSDMLAFKKPIRSQAFRPGVMQLRLEELVETGQFELALSKAKEFTDAYKFLPSNNPYLREFLLIKANAAEAVGDINTFAAVLDTLEKNISQNFTKNSNAFADIQLRKADLNVKYFGEFNSATRSYANFYDGHIKLRISDASIDNIAYYNGQINACKVLSKNDSVVIYSQKALSSAVKSFGVNSPEALYFESVLAFGQFDCREYKKMQETLVSLNAKNVAEQFESNPYYIQALFLQSQLYEWLGEYTKVRELVYDANEISKRKSEQRFFEQTSVNEALANSYILNGNYLRADKNLKLSMDIKLKKVGENSFLLIQPYLQFISLKIQKGELKEADKYLQNVEKLLNQFFTSANSKFHIDFFLYKSRYFSSIADYRKSKEAVLSAIEITTKIYGKNHIRLAPLFAELAKVSLDENKSNSAEAFSNFEKAKLIIENSIGKESPAYMKLIVQEATLLIEVGKYDAAEKSLLEADKFWTLKLGNENQQLAEIQSIKGLLYYNQKKYANADKAYKKAAVMYESLFNKRHPGYLSAQTCLAKVAYMFNQYVEAASILEPVLIQRLKFVDNNFSIMSFGQKSGFWASFREEFEFYNSIATKLIASKAQIGKATDMYNFALSTKGLLLNSDAKLRRQIFGSGDSTLIANFNEWQFQKEYFSLVASYSKSQLDEEKISLEKVEQNIEDLEKQIQSKAGVNISNGSKKVSWQDVKKAIGKNSTAIEMIKFRYFDHVLTDSIIYASLFVDETTNETPKLIVMPNGKRMEGRSLNYYRNASINKQEDLYSHQVYLMPLKANIPDGNTVYFAGEGVYTQLNPEMLYNGDLNKYALETNGFVFLTSTRDVIIDTDKKSNTRNNVNNRFYLYGNPTFYSGKIFNPKTSISQLEGAEKEVIDINEKLKSLGRETVNLTGKLVTEDTIKSLESAYVLHIATHGYFLERKSTGSELINNPMLNSGLLMANAGTLLQTPDLGYINQKSGVLTASEVMDLNFSKTKLVVLSACETGRGQVEVGEGVYGLQRAFLMAGANAIILSLFKVDDEATRLLMLKFYEKFLTNGNDYRKAFREAKQELRNSKEFSSPIYWGAFIMIEGTQTEKTGS
ncbi:MAG: CHAT domain-containing protein [Cytophagales bacterium]